MKGVIILTETTDQYTHSASVSVNGFSHVLKAETSNTVSVTETSERLGWVCAALDSL